MAGDFTPRRAGHQRRSQLAQHMHSHPHQVRSRATYPSSASCNFYVEGAARLTVSRAVGRGRITTTTVVRADPVAGAGATLVQVPQPQANLAHCRTGGDVGDRERVAVTGGKAPPVAPDVSQGLILTAIGRDGSDQRDERVSGRTARCPCPPYRTRAAPPERVRYGATGLGAFANLCRPGGRITSLVTAAAGSARGTGRALCGCGWRQGVPR